MYYKVKIKYLGADEAGDAKRVTEHYIVSAETVIDAEARLLASGTFEDYTIESITKPRVDGITQSGAGRFYRCKLAVGASGEGKPCVLYTLVQAAGFDEAVGMCREQLAGAPGSIEFVTLTPIVGYVE